MLENPVPARAVRREGRRRDADRRPGAGGRQRAAARRLRPARDSRDAGEDDGAMQVTLNGKDAVARSDASHPMTRACIR